MKFLLIIILLHSAILSKATEIVGLSKVYALEKVELVSYIDAINNIPSTIESIKIKEDGQFNFKFNLNHTQLISIKIKDYKASFYVTPSGKYKINIDEFDTQSAPPLSRNKILNFNFIEQDQDSVNFKIMNVSKALESFQNQYYLAYLNNRVKDLLPKLDSSLSEIDQSNQFIADYCQYTYARQVLFAGVDQKEVYKSYLANSLDLNNPAYGELFDDFYSKWLDRYQSKNDKNWLYSSIYNQNLDSLTLLLSKNDFLENQTILELIAAKELYREAHELKKFERKNTITLLQKLSTTTTNKDIRKTCEYYLINLEQLSIGNPAPEFNLIDQKGNSVSLEQFKGKYVFIDFWATWCKPCIKSMAVLNSIYPTYKDSVVFISICIDENEELYKGFIQRNDYPWLFSYPKNQSSLKENYKVYALPIYYLIDREGKLLQSPAFGPGDGLEMTLKGLFIDRTKKGPVIWDWDQEKPGNNK